MPSRKLPNYLRLHRKRTGFSEEEIAFLLGLHGSAQVSRYEHFHAIPGLLTALGYHVIFQTSLPALFGGKYQKVERMIRRRAKRLLKKLSGQQPSRRLDLKLAWLRALAGEPQSPKHP
jgi:transcriptional regulator with XRE-family HTH domain